MKRREFVLIALAAAFVPSAYGQTPKVVGFLGPTAASAADKRTSLSGFKTMVGRMAVTSPSSIGGQTGKLTNSLCSLLSS
jgi:hypothetical protein